MTDKQEEASNLVKVSCLLTRRSDLSHEEFQHYWTEVHTPMLAKPVPGAPKVYRYVQLHTLPDEIAELATAPFSCVAEIWFEKLEDAKAMFTSEHYHSVVSKDEEKFLDLSKTVFLTRTRSQPAPFRCDDRAPVPVEGFHGNSDRAKSPAR